MYAREIVILHSTDICWTVGMCTTINCIHVPHVNKYLPMRGRTDTILSKRETNFCQTRPVNGFQAKFEFLEIIFVRNVDTVFTKHFDFLFLWIIRYTGHSTYIRLKSFLGNFVVIRRLSARLLWMASIDIWTVIVHVHIYLAAKPILIMESLTSIDSCVLPVSMDLWI